ncbi:response regulator transcription factor [Acetivibrio ethanolgignens]|uniref:Stage 0 sporulation protein A homolog n=1 Tax=Acetivibrio ethanolgignens TaxID=290052 RepID=A0A0V8QEH0_9FIRM|nr:two-component system response regulator [Acetivibrio ethanolgignens]
MKTIYIADDEADICDLIKSFLEKEGFCVTTFETGDSLLEAFEKEPADLLIIDVMMPGTDGLTICSAIREKSSVPIIMLTARGTDADFITGFTMGCDDYFTKPFSPIKLTLRVKAMLKRMNDNQNREGMSFGDITLYPMKKAAYSKGEELKLTNTEYGLLQYMVNNKERAVSRDELLQAVWGYDSFVETRATDDTIKRLRKKLLLAKSTVLIETVWGFGFKLRKQES